MVLAIRSKTIEIQASPEKAWEVLTDFERDGEWNPFNPQIRATPSVMFSPVDILVAQIGRDSKPNRVVEQLCVFLPPRQLSWSVYFGHPAILRAQRDQLITPLGEQRCSYMTVDWFSGWIMKPVMRFQADNVQRGFDAVADAFKARCESL